jgi:NAD(P) transhydrogenase subunit alpha
LDLLSLIIIFALALFLGYEVITKVPSTLHTPLMSGSNAISGIVIVGAIIIASNADGILAIILSVVAIVLATINVIGGFMVTDRMLAMFKKRRNKD